MPADGARRSYTSGPALEGLTGGTLADVFLDSAARYEGDAASRRRPDGTWESFPRSRLVARVRGLAAGLRELGCAAGDRVAILSHTRLEWALADWASLLGGHVVVTVYPVLPPEQVAYILRDSGARLVFAADAEQLAKLVEVQGELDDLQAAVLFDPAPGAPTGDLRVVTLDDLERIGSDAPAERFEAEARAIEPGDLATVLYTSGTTGAPKGVMLTHENLHANVKQCASVLPIGPSDVMLSWLPLSHALERTVGHFLAWSCGARIAYGESTETVARDMAEVQPTLMIGVPRMYEKFYEVVEEVVNRGGAVRKAIFSFARRVGRTYTERRTGGRAVGPLVGLGHRIADRLVFRKLRARTGGRVRYFVSGAAPLSPEVNRFFFAAGMTVLEGYGLTETSPVTNVNPPDDIRFGTVGPPLPATELRIAEDGEILFRGPQVMAGYFGDTEATAAVLEPDGWLHTGDIGELDDDGYLTITDRKKNLIVTSAGKNVAPNALEERMARSPYVENVVLVGDRRKFTIALAVPSLAALEAAFPGREVSLEQRPELALEPEVADLLEKDLLARTQEFAHYERPKLVIPIPQPFTVEDGTLTPTMKVKRRAVTERYADLIERRYEEAERAYDREQESDAGSGVGSEG
ncbi:MAG: long-chain fatty acid--CoA ligase [Gemmatimonadales bacterium]|jgi:long-chain acyl-CoA synthetase